MKEYVNHPGYYAVGFDADGDDNLPFPLATEVAMSSKDNPQTLVNGTTILAVRSDSPDNCNAQPNKTCTVSVTLPNMKCENCTLQLVQVMTTLVPYNSFYFQCADIRIADGVDPVDPPPGGDDTEGGCSAGSGAGLAMLGFVVAFARRRRR